MIKVHLSFKTMLEGGVKNSLKVKKLVDKMPVSEQVKSRELFDVYARGFSESRTMKNDTLVIRHYRLNENIDKATIVEKSVFPSSNKGKSVSEGGIDYMTGYSDEGNFLATIKCDSKNSNYTTFYKDKESGIMVSKKGLGAYNKAVGN